MRKSALLREQAETNRLLRAAIQELAIMARAMKTLADTGILTTPQKVKIVSHEPKPRKRVSKKA